MTQFFVRHADATQIMIFAVAVSLLWLVEKTIVAQPEGQKLRHTSVNGLFILTALPAELVLSMVCLFVSAWATEHDWGLLALMPDPSSPWVKYGLAFVALDLCDYGYHRVMHHVPMLWRFHLVHHTDQAVDSSTTVREHPGESLVRGAFLVLWTFLLGASFEVLLMRQAAETVSAVLAHSSVRLPGRVGRIAGWLFITPNLHHVHHHFELPYTNCNYGGVFSVWDRLFGTFTELSEDKTIFGLDTHMEPKGIQDFKRLITMPFNADPGGECAGGNPFIAIPTPEIV